MSGINTNLKVAWATALTANDSAAKEEVGILRWDYDATYGLRCYRYMLAHGTVAAGTALSYMDAYKFVATPDISDGHINCPAGVGIGAITDTYYGWVQCYGYFATILTDAGDDIADGGALILHASTDGTVDVTASGTAPVSIPIGVAVAADVDATDTVAGFINCI